MSQLRSLTASLLVVCGLAACAVHEPVPAFRSTVWIGDRGISVPLPPPSFFEAPQQEVEVSGEVTGASDLAAGAEIRIVDTRGDAELSVALNEGQLDFLAVLELDLSNTCLEVWLVASDGAEGSRALYSTRIVSETEVEVVEGCD